MINHKSEQTDQNQSAPNIAQGPANQSDHTNVHRDRNRDIVTMLPLQYGVVEEVFDVLEIFSIGAVFTQHPANMAEP